MIEIRNFVICDNTQVVPMQDQKGAITVLVNPQPVLRAKYIPGVLSFALSFGIVGIKITDIRNVEVKIYPESDTSKCTVAKQEITFSLDSNQDPEDIFPTINFDMRNVEIIKEGKLLVDIAINDQHISQFVTTIKRIRE